MTIHKPHAVSFRALWATTFFLAFTLSACSPTPTPLPQAIEATTTSAPAPTTPATPSAITLTDGLKNTISLQGPAQRIVSLAPSNTEILFAIGAGDQVIARDSLSDYPETVKQLPDIGGGFKAVNAESVVSLKPDLILAADATPLDQVKALQDLGLTVFLLKNPRTLDEMYANLEITAQLTGHETQAKDLIQSLKKRVLAVTEKTAKVSSHPSVFYELESSDPTAPWTSGAGTFIDTLLTMAGGSNLGNILKTDWGQIPLEQLIIHNPDYILLGDYTYGGVTPEAVAARPGWQQLKAVQEQRVYIFNDNLVGRPGPRLVDGLEALAKLLHPDLFQ